MGTHDRDKPAIEGGVPVREDFLSFYRPSVDEDDIASVADAVRSGWLTLGPRTERLEAELKAFLGVRNVVALSSCTDAMFLALKALGIGPGDEVITSPLTFASTVHAIIHTGAAPVLADIEDATFGVSPEEIERKLSPATKAVLPVHFGGQACRIGAILELARNRGLFVIEDAAHSFGASWNGTAVGAFGNATAFSFYATKNITTGEGGCIATADDGLADAVRKLGFHGMSRDAWKRYTDRGSWYYEVESPGYKCNMSDIHAALGLSQLRKAGYLLERRKQIAELYREGLGESPFFRLPAAGEGNVHTWHLYVIRLAIEALRIDRDQFIKALTEERIGSSVHFIPIHRHPFFKPMLGRGERYPACDDFFDRCISLPLYAGMSERDVKTVVDALKRIAAYYER